MRPDDDLYSLRRPDGGVDWPAAIELVAVICSLGLIGGAILASIAAWWLL